MSLAEKVENAELIFMELGLDPAGNFRRVICLNAEEQHVIVAALRRLELEARKSQ